MIDRRKFVTGLTLVGFAPFGFAPSGGSASLVCVGQAFTQYSPHRFPSLDALEASPLAQGWRCHFHNFWERTLCHDPTGLMFATAGRDPCAVWLVRPPDASEVPAYTPELFRLGAIARFLRISAYVVDYHRRHNGEPRDRAFYIHFVDGSDTYEIEDAPALPRIASFADGVL
jgi:hypothetical protein